MIMEWVLAGLDPHAALKDDTHGLVCGGLGYYFHCSGILKGRILEGLIIGYRHKWPFSSPLEGDKKPDNFAI